MPHPLSIFPKSEDQSLNFRLWTGVLLPPLAGGVNTLVAYMVSNYACSVHNRHLVFVVNLVTLGLCGISILISRPLHSQIEQTADDSTDLAEHPASAVGSELLVCRWIFAFHSGRNSFDVLIASM